MDGVGGYGGDPTDAAEAAVEHSAAAATAGGGQRPESPDSPDGYTSDMLVQGAVGPFEDDEDGAVRAALLGKRRPTGSPSGPSAKRSPARGSDEEEDEAFVDALEGDALAHLEQ